MDTAVNEQDGRAGACIEIQALFLAQFKLMKLLCKELNITYTGYKALEKMFVEKIKKSFFKDGILYDRLDDKTIRPNVFLAYYLYPELLKEEEWKKVFDSAIRVLWLEWGGFSTIDKKHELFQNKYTGENNLSYHRGDSWYWINNIAAICMRDLDYEKYKHYVDKIFAASEDNLLFGGFLGCASELSSAEKKESKGCLSQAWSSATFVELADKMNKN
jgi:glycogen debranching enzyme